MNCANAKYHIRGRVIYHIREPLANLIRTISPISLGPKFISLGVVFNDKRPIITILIKCIGLKITFMPFKYTTILSVAFIVCDA